MSVSKVNLALLSKKDFEEFIYREQQKIIEQLIQKKIDDYLWTNKIFAGQLPYDQEKDG